MPYETVRSRGWEIRIKFFLLTLNHQNREGHRVGEFEKSLRYVTWHRLAFILCHVHPSSVLDDDLNRKTKSQDRQQWQLPRDSRWEHDTCPTSWCVAALRPTRHIFKHDFTNPWLPRRNQKFPNTIIRKCENYHQTPKSCCQLWRHHSD
jgi:hypothetical protein